MMSVTATAARKDIYNLISLVNEESAPVAITNTKGKGAVLVGEEDWASIEETLYIMSIPGMTEKLITAHNEGFENGVSAEELEW